MLVQVWKNTVGNKFPYVVEDDKVIATVPRGSSERIYDFALLIAQMENTLGRFIRMSAELNQDSLLEITIELTEIPIPDGYYGIEFNSKDDLTQPDSGSILESSQESVDEPSVEDVIESSSEQIQESAPRRRYKKREE